MDKATLKTAATDELHKQESWLRTNRKALIIGNITGIICAWLAGHLLNLIHSL